MSAACPKCQSKLPLNNSPNVDETISCPACQATLKIEIKVEIVDPPEKASAQRDEPALPTDTPSEGRKKVILCIDGEGTREMIKEILVESRFSLLDVPNGKEALSAIRQHRPAITLIDMGLSDVVGTELCSNIKDDPELRDTAVILVASMYDRTSKRHGPDSLLGADDYIDRGLIQKGLLEKVENLLVKEKKHENGEKPPASVQEENTPPVAVEEEVSAGKSDLASEVEVPESAPEKESAAEKDAKRLARIIVSDIALYNPKKVDEGIQNDTFFNLLEEEIEEGKEHYLSRVSETLTHPMAYLDEAFTDYINKRKTSS